MDRRYEEIMLYDFYGELLTPRQKEIYEAVIMNDLSLGEAAENFGISRQAVYDLLRRTEKALRNYEDRLGLVQRFLKLREKAGEIRKRTDDPRIRKLTDEILEDL